MRENESYKNEYATKDLQFAAFLKVKGISIIRLERIGQKFDTKDPVYFVFEDRDKCLKLERVFWDGVGEDIFANIKEYVNTLKDLRSRVFSIVRGPMEDTLAH